MRIALIVLATFFLLTLVLFFVPIPDVSRFMRELLIGSTATFPAATAPPRTTDDAMNAIFTYDRNPTFSFSYPLFPDWEVEAGELAIRYGERGVPMNATGSPSIRMGFAVMSDPNAFAKEALKNTYGVPYKEFGRTAPGEAERTVFDVQHPGGLYLEVFTFASGLRGDTLRNSVIRTLQVQ